MNTLVTSVKTRRFVVIAFASTFVCVTVLLGASGISRFQRQSGGQDREGDKFRFVGPAKASAQLSGPTNIVNHTQALQVLPLETTTDGRLLLKVKNVSSKNVNTFVMARDGGEITLDASSGDRAIAPGTVEELMMPVPRDIGSLQILAVAFTDGSIEGEPESVAELRRARSDLKLQLSRGLSALKGILDSPEADTPAGLDRLERQFSSLETRQNPNADGQGRGLYTGKDDLISDIQFLRTRLQRHGELSQRKLLMRLKDRLERRTSAV